MHITSLEAKTIDFITRHKYIVYLCLVTILAFCLRITGFSFISNDMKTYLLPWFFQIQDAGGFVALSKQVGDYTIPYQLIIAAAGYTNINPVIFLKLVSIFFDLLLAVCVFMLIYLVFNKHKILSACIAYTLILILPPFVFNSAWWGQCDSIYSCFCIISLLFLIKKKYNFALSFLGFALAFKLQAIFLLPCFLFFYLKDKEFSIFTFLLIPLIVFLCFSPAIFLGRSPFDLFSAYFTQIGEHRYMSIGALNIWGALLPTQNDLAHSVVSVGQKYHLLLRPFAILFCIVVFLILAVLFLRITKRLVISYRKVFVLIIAGLSIYTSVMFLPEMHERYLYLLDIILVVLTCLEISFMPICILEICLSTMLYTHSLFFANLPLQLLSCISVLLYLGYIFISLHVLNLKVDSSCS